MFGDDTLASIRQQIRTPLPTPKAEPKFNAWGLVTAIPRGIGEAGAQVMATTAEVVTALKYMRDTPTKDMPSGVPVEAMQSDFADSLRDRGREFRPDPETAHVAEQVLYGFSRGVAKIGAGAAIAGPAGVVAAGIEEGVSASDDLKRQGVTDPNVRAQAGMVQGAGLALAALPVVGQTIKATAGLYAVGGPGGFMAQQALTRKILQDAGHGDIAAGFDPLDPVGLAISSLIPGAFAAAGIRGQRRAAAARADAELIARPTPGEQTGTAAAVRDAYSPEVVDAARLSLLAEQRAATNPQPWSMRSADVHEQALSRAEDAMARGEPVQVAQDVLAAHQDIDYFTRQIDDLQTQRAALLADAGQAAEPGAIRLANQERRLMEQTRPDASEETIRALAKELQERSGESYKSSLAKAKKQIGEAVTDWEARAARLDDAIQRNAKASQADQQIAKLDTAIAQFEARKAEAEAVTNASPLSNFAAAIDQLRQARNHDAAAQAQPAPPQGRAPEAAAPQGKPRDLRSELIALRKEKSVLTKLLECVANG